MGSDLLAALMLLGMTRLVNVVATPLDWPLGDNGWQAARLTPVGLLVLVLASAPILEGPVAPALA